MHRLFLPQDQFPNITGSDAHYVRDVLRCRVGDGLELFDGSGLVYTARIARIEKDQIVFTVESSRRTESEPEISITLAQSLPKGHKMDLIIEKCTELGVARIIPVLTERAVAKEAKSDRWRRIAKEAAEQSGRAYVPEISEAVTFDAILKLGSKYDLSLIPWELEKEATLKKALTTHQPNHLTTYQPWPELGRGPNHLTSLLILIGPEGGFSREEVSTAKKAGFISISLGKRILRTETAGMAVLAAVGYEFSL